MTTVKFRSSQVELKDSLEEVNSYFYQKRMTDGLPIVPPTRERVSLMLQGTRRDPTEVVGKLAPVWGAATVEKIAVNAVMAGCEPAYLPVLIAAVEAICEPEWNLHGVQTCTGAVGPMLVINGPIRQRLEVNCGAGVLGPGWKANATIGRAMRFILLNIGGATPGDVDKATMGWPGKYGMCIGENEEQSPWEPLHVEQGFKREESCVTAIGVDSSAQITDISPWPEQVLHEITYGIIKIPLGLAATSTGQREEGGQGPGPIVLLNPVFARMFAKIGHTKQSLKQHLWERSRFPAEWVPPTSPTHVKPVDGKLPLTDRAERFVVIVTGSDSGYHATSMHCLMGKPITKRVSE